MASKKFSNKIVVTLLLIGVIGGAIATYIVATSNGGKKKHTTNIPCETCLCDSLSTPDYCTLRDNIMKYAKKDWDKQDYNAILANINQYAAAEPEPLIDEVQKADLAQLLTSKYLAALSKASGEFCKKGTYSDMNRLIELEDGLKDIKTTQTDVLNSIKDLLGQFRTALTLDNTIQRYTNNQKFDAGTAASYRRKIDSILQANYLKENIYLRSNLSRAIDDMETHEAKNDLFELKRTNGELSSYDCDRFLPYSYYKEECERAHNADQSATSN